MRGPGSDRVGGLGVLALVVVPQLGNNSHEQIGAYRWVGRMGRGHGVLRVLHGKAERH